MQIDSREAHPHIAPIGVIRFGERVSCRRTLERSKAGTRRRHIKTWPSNTVGYDMPGNRDDVGLGHQTCLEFSKIEGGGKEIIIKKNKNRVISRDIEYGVALSGQSPRTSDDHDRKRQLCRSNVIEV